MNAESLRHHLGDARGEPEVYVEVNGLQYAVTRCEDKGDRIVLHLTPPKGYCRHGQSTCWQCFMVNGEST